MSKEEKEFKFIQLPLSLIDLIPDSLGDIISYGICRYAIRLPYKKHDVYRQVAYLYYKGTLTHNLVNEIDSLILSGAFTNMSDYSGFDSNGELDLEENTGELIEAWDCEISLYKECILVYQIYLSADSLNIKLGSCSSTINSYEFINHKVLQFERKYGNDALTSISLDMAFDFRDSDKDYYEIELLKAFLAIKSFQGKAKLCETNKEALTMRMTGSKSKEVLKDKRKALVNKKLIEKFNKRYHIDKLLTDLRIRGFIQSKLPNSRSIFISTSLNDKELAKAAFELIKTKEQKTQKAIIKKQENEAKNLLNQLLQGA